jgi:hypothetical protein
MPKHPTNLPQPRFLKLALLGLLAIAMAWLPGSGVPVYPGFIGEDFPTSLSVCEQEEDGNGDPRPECQAGDVRIELQTSADDPVPSEFGFSLATGLVNGDEFADLVVGDPGRDRVYVFFGRKSVVAGYDLNPEMLFDREVSPEDQADVILAAGASLAGRSFGFSVAVGRDGTAGSCDPDDLAHPILIGAPDRPGTMPGTPGRVVYIPAGALCLPATDPAAPTTFDPLEIGETFQAPVIEENDEFGYSVAFGRILTDEAPDGQEDVVVGARGARGGAGRVTVFPVVDGSVVDDVQQVVALEGNAGDGLGEVLAVGDLDSDFDSELNPTGAVDDLAAGAVGQGAGKVLLLQGPLSPTGGTGGDGVFRTGDREVRAILGEEPGDYFGFSVAVNGDGLLGVGAIYADNTPPATGGGQGGDARTNVGTASRINAGKVYGWAPRLFESTDRELEAAGADLVVVARRSGDQLGFAVAFEDLDGTGVDDLMMTARREDGSGLTVDEIDQGTAYIILDTDVLTSPVDLNLCVTSSDCTGVAGIGLMVFGGDRGANAGDEMGFAAATGDFNADGFNDLFVSSLTRNRVYILTFEDSDDDREFQGRNIRDDDDDDDLDPDSTDCAPLDPLIFDGAEEIACNEIDENCNGMDDDAPDADGDGFDACGDIDNPPDCDDSDPNSYPGAPQLCDGNANDCLESLPTNELDLDGDGYIGCSGYDDTQSDNPEILGGDDCDVLDPATFPGAAPNESEPAACMTDFDEDDFGDTDPFQGVTPGTDCDDVEPGTFPGAAPLDDPVNCLSDADDDGYGDAFASDPVLAGSDCDDDDPISFPGAAESCDGNDNACSGEVPDNESDLDGDGWAACGVWNDVQDDDPAIAGGGDCNDLDPDTFPGAAPREPLAMACMQDADGDDFGDLTPPPGVSKGTDCDDDSPTTFPGAAAIDGPLNCMKDDDDDDHGDDSVALPIVRGTDCDDDDATRFSGATDVPDDGIDQNCNGSDTITCYVDGDGDGFGSTTELLADDGDCTDEGESDVDTDCDDSDETVYPGNAEIADDGIDQDCNGFDTITCYVDGDGDGYGDPAATSTLADDGSCDADQGESISTDDCDDTDPSTFPDAGELCDGNDNACSGQVPGDEIDGDGDTYVACLGWNDTQGDNPEVSGGDDCNDQASDTFPGAADQESDPTACRKDRDEDGFGDLVPPPGVTPGTDCDDVAADTFPGAALADGPLNCMKDSDDDEFGDALAALPVVAGADCDDDDPRSFAGAPELCDGNDNACAGTVPEDEMDGDGDDFVACSGWDDTQGDNPGVLGGGDCDETDTDTFPGAAPNEPAFPLACRTDRDGDGFGELQPAAWVNAGTDCDDGAVTTFPGAAEFDAPLNCMKDDDDDGYGDAAAVLPVVPGRDCNDDLPVVNPGTLEGPQGDPTCSDGLDNDCDALTDDQDPVCSGGVDVCPDADNDGFADCVTNPTCDATGLVCGDCNDSLAGDNPNADEVCDNQDNNCDGVTDEGFDQDSDSYTSCDLPVPDCDDTRALVNPGAVELCDDATDNDCDAATPDLFDGDNDGATCDLDCDDGDPALNLADGDSDSFSTCAGDCDDTEPAINPAAAELCNDGVDNDCSAATPDLFDGDEDGAICNVDCDDGDATLNLSDSDSDTFTSCAGDCDDGNNQINPDATEVCDGVDNNCNTLVDEDFDLDSDTFTTCGGDCNDGDPAINPGATEACNDGVDNDCDAGTPDIFDSDADGATCDLDCDDGDVNSFPGASERCDGNDNACTGTVPADEIDGDDDTYVACSGWADTQGDDPGIAGGDDCDASDPGTFPGSAPNETFPDACRRDQDGDDFGDQSPPAGVVPGTDCDDGAIATFPGAAEIEGPLNCMSDVDDDGWGDASALLPVVRGTDCADDDGTRFPGADDVCGDGIDSDCDGSDPPCPSATQRSGFRRLRVDPTSPGETGTPGRKSDGSTGRSTRDRGRRE